MEDVARKSTLTSGGEEQTAAVPADVTRENWSNKLLPLMGLMVIGLTLFFFIASAIQLAYLHVEIRKAPQPDLAGPMAMLQGSVARTADRQNATIAILSSLELSAMEFRYHQANVALLSRVWTRYMGFVTGMVLAMVGAAFILGRLQDRGSEASGKSSAGEFAFKTASPGLVMAVLGVAMMITTITTHHEIAVKDQAIFLSGLGLTNPPAVDGRLPKPAPFPPEEAAARNEGVSSNGALGRLNGNRRQLERRRREGAGVTR